MSTLPPTPPSDSSPLTQRIRTSEDPQLCLGDPSMHSNDDNTAAGMARSQEDSMYLTPAASPTTTVPEEKEVRHASQADTGMEEDAIKQPCQTRSNEAVVRSSGSDIEQQTISSNPKSRTTFMRSVCDAEEADDMEVDPAVKEAGRSNALLSSTNRTNHEQDGEVPRGLAKIDLTLNRSSQISAWDFTDKRPFKQYPSSLFQPYSRYTGSQQSDRQTYNVEVTILTVDVDQCSLSGYLLIRGLTPELPIIQTFFTGEIVGGPNQRYSFRTMEPAWGANDKVDLQHWLRFPAWRHLSSHAKKDMSFDFPFNDEPWYDQDHIFMRWKEHFLVPDHRQSNIIGASFSTLR